MVKIYTRNFNVWIKDQANVRLALRNNLYTYNLAKHFKKIVKENIEALGHYTGSGHNTPTQLIQSLNGPVKEGGNYLVKMDEYPTTAKSTGQTFNLVELVEKGTRPHLIPKYVGEHLVSVIEHPGARARWFWRNSIRSFNSEVDEVAIREVSKETKIKFNKK